MRQGVKFPDNALQLLMRGSRASLRIHNPVTNASGSIAMPLTAPRINNSSYKVSNQGNGGLDGTEMCSLRRTSLPPGRVSLE